MAIYVFESKKGDILEKYFPMNEAPRIGDEVIIDKKKYKRIPAIPRVSIDTKFDGFDKKKFMEKTAKGGTLGDLSDLSREMSNKRKQQTGGQDDVRDKFIESSKPSRGGKFVDI